MREKIKDQGDLERIIRRLRDEGKRIVFTNGCFDLFHVGHLRYLEEARALGDVLVVGVNSDPSVRRLKGPKRPILPAGERAEVLSGLECVDFVTIFHELDPSRLIALLRPHLLVKGGDWTKETVVGRELVEGWGGEIRIIPLVEGASTSQLIETIVNKYEKRH